MDMLLCSMWCNFERSTHDMDRTVCEERSEAKDMKLCMVANAVDLNGSPVVVDQHCIDGSARGGKTRLAIEFVIKFILLRVPSQQVELCNIFRKVPSEVHHG